MKKDPKQAKPIISFRIAEEVMEDFYEILKDKRLFNTSELGRQFFMRGMEQYKLEKEKQKGE